MYKGTCPLQASLPGIAVNFNLNKNFNCKYPQLRTEDEMC